MEKWISEKLNKLKIFRKRKEEEREEYLKKAKQCLVDMETADIEIGKLWAIHKRNEDGENISDMPSLQDASSLSDSEKGHQ